MSKIIKKWIFLTLIFIGHVPPVVLGVIMYVADPDWWMGPVLLLSTFYSVGCLTFSIVSKKLYLNDRERLEEMEEESNLFYRSSFIEAAVSSGLSREEARNRWDARSRGE